jgi:hippurate hydrolase
VTTATYNDPPLTERVAKALASALGQDKVVRISPVMGSEDFGYLSLNQQIPAAYFFIGASDPAKIEQSRQTGVPLPSLHSSLFAPVPEPTIRTGVKMLTVAALDLMKKQ